MKPRSSSTLIASTLALFALSGAANASTVTISSDTNTIPSADIFTAPSSTSGNYEAATTGSNAGQASPWAASGTPNAAYTYLSCGPSGVSGTATYTAGPSSTGFSIFWGSPDAYNTVEFLDGSTVEASFIGTNLNPPAGSGAQLVTFAFNGLDITSVVLIDSGTAAFEYSNVQFTPIPAALPLFAGGLGLMGLLGRRRKQKGVVALPA
jgi:hypothetical protein